MDLDRLLDIAERARTRGALNATDKQYIAEEIPRQLADFPRMKLPGQVRHPAGFVVKGAPVGTLLRSALLVAGQRVLGRRFGGARFYEEVEKDLAMQIMRTHFHHGAPKGTHCCAQCTLLVVPVLESGAIRWFDCREQLRNVQRVVRGKQWRFRTTPNGAMLDWALGAARQ